MNSAVSTAGTSPGPTADTSSPSDDTKPIARREAISFVICAYTLRRWGDLCASVESAVRQLHDGDECILVIDHNEELRALAEASLSGAHVVESRGPRGLSGARNTGVALAANNVVVFLDDDAVAAPGLADAVASAMQDPNVVAVGGSPEPVWPSGSRPWWFAEEFDWVVGCSYNGLPTTRAEVRNVIGAAMAFRRDVLNYVGPFSSAIGRVGTLPMGCEETELCIRVRQHLPRSIIYHLPDARVAHHVTADRTTWRYFLRRCYSEGVSKALISDMVGKQDALASERSYLVSVLPRAVLRNSRAILCGRIAASGKIAAIVLGVALTVLGYARGRTKGAACRRRAFMKASDANTGTGSAAAPFQPILVADVDLKEDALVLPPHSPSGQRYDGADVLIRDEATPVELVRVPAASLGRPLNLGEIIGVARRPQAPEAIPVATAISVVVPTYGRPYRAAQCVRSILATGWRNVEVLIVDNNPGDLDSAAVLRDLVQEDPRLRYIAAHQRGASAARNVGLAMATNEIIAFTDDDVLVDKHWLAVIASAFDDPKVTCVTGLIRPQRLDTPAQLWFERYGGFGKGLTPKKFQLQMPEGSTSALYPFAAGMFGSGNNVAFKRSALLQLGGYDTHLGPGVTTRAGEDLDLFIRVILAGHVLSYDPRALVHHDHRADPSQLLRQLYDYGCGLSAMLCAQGARDYKALLAIVRRIPQGIRLMADPSSTKNRERGRGYPTRFVFAEWGGMAVGPALYMMSRLKAAVERER